MVAGGRPCERGPVQLHLGTGGTPAEGNIWTHARTDQDPSSCGRCKEMGLSEVRIAYTGGTRGWPGDVPKSFLVPDKLAQLGFRVRHSSDDAVRLAVRELVREWKARAPASR